MLSGPVFFFSFAVSGIFWGVYAKRVNRVWLLGVSGIVWCLTTALTG